MKRLQCNWFYWKWIGISVWSQNYTSQPSRWAKFKINVYELWQMSKINIECDWWRMVRSYKKKGWVPTLLGPTCPKKRKEKKTFQTDRPVQMSARFISTISISNFQLNCFRCCFHTPGDFWFFSFYNSNIGFLFKSNRIPDSNCGKTKLFRFEMNGFVLWFHPKGNTSGSEKTAGNHFFSFVQFELLFSK